MNRSIGNLADRNITIWSILLVELFVRRIHVAILNHHCPGNEPKMSRHDKYQTVANNDSRVETQ